MQGTYNDGKPHYRCRHAAEYARGAVVDHPRTVYVLEDVILPALDEWIATVFAPGRLTATLRTRQQAQEAETTTNSAAEAARLHPCRLRALHHPVSGRPRRGSRSRARHRVDQSGAEREAGSTARSPRHDSDSDHDPHN
ncbi:hypothetical protein [Streptomyces lonegramiae]|uniref:hypothetical protein n=1 Tax=Streptomyces lonegramiae TaxID=3075524 RepID=UPI00374E0B33